MANVKHLQMKEKKEMKQASYPLKWNAKKRKLRSLIIFPCCLAFSVMSAEVSRRHFPLSWHDLTPSKVPARVWCTKRTRTWLMLVNWSHIHRPPLGWSATANCSPHEGLWTSTTLIFLGNPFWMLKVLMVSPVAPVPRYCSRRHGVIALKPSPGPHVIRTKGTPAPASQFPLTHVLLLTQVPRGGGLKKLRKPGGWSGQPRGSLY